MNDLMSAAPCGFVTFADDGTMVELNQTLADLLHYTRHDLLGWHVDKILPPGGRIFYHTYLFPMLKMQGSVEEIYATLRTRDGDDIPVILNGIRRERDGRFVSDCVCMRMIQRHEFEDQLVQARRLAEESSAAKAKFLSMMSHDLRTPLTAIQGNAALLDNGVFGPLTEEQRQAVHAIREACRTQMTLMTDILEFARIDSGHVQVQPRDVRVADVVERAVALIRIQMTDAGLRLDTKDCDGAEMVRADPDRLQQILLNLLTNAMKFTPAGGEITIMCETHGECVRIRVRDTGIGVAPHDLLRIFAPFVQVGAPSANGVGLGLAISRDLARAMDGDVTVESTEGAGSVFTIELPAVHTVVA